MENVGIITEQGDLGLGYNELSDKDKAMLNNETKEDDDCGDE